MKNWNADAIRARIAEMLPEGYVIPRHRDNGHFYEVDLASQDEWINRFFEDGYILPKKEYPEGQGPISGMARMNPVYPSVTGKLQILKDEGLMNYKMNKAVEYLKNFIYSTKEKLHMEPEGSLMEMIDKACTDATNITGEILKDAGEVGTLVHDTREVIFQQWIKTGVKPTNFPGFLPAGGEDVRAISCLRALESFVNENDYIPVACELLVYDHEYEVAGTLDDLGLMRQVLREGDKTCEHFYIKGINGKFTCPKCDAQYRYEFVLMDLKTSNQFKDHYFFQVCLYWWKLRKLLGRAWAPERCFILKVSKEDGRYKIEDLKQPLKLAKYAMHMLKTNEGMEFIKSLRKDNQKKVISI